MRAFSFAGDFSAFAVLRVVCRIILEMGAFLLLGAQRKSKVPRKGKDSRCSVFCWALFGRWFCCSTSYGCIPVLGVRVSAVSNIRKIVQIFISIREYTGMHVHSNFRVTSSLPTKDLF